MAKQSLPKPRYGEAYEAKHKDSKKPMKPTSHGIAPKLDPKKPEIKEDSKPKTTKPEVKPASVKPLTAKTADKTKKTPCSTYGGTNKCEGVPCKQDEDCASTCCSTAMGSNGAQSCHAVI